MVNPAFYATPEEAVFSVKLVMAKGNSWASGVVSLRNNAAIMKSTGFDSAAWISGLSADVVNLADVKCVFFLAFAPRDSLAPSKMSEFWSIPTRRFGATGPDTGAVSISPPLTSALSFKVKGSEEDKVQAVLLLGVRSATSATSDLEYHFGVRTPLGRGLAGFVEGVAEVAS